MLRPKNLRLLIRFLATSSEKPPQSSKIIKSPVSVTGIAGRYATALYSAAIKTNRLDQIEVDLRRFQKALRENDEIREAMENPFLNKQLLTDAIEELDVEPAVSNLLTTMIENNRLDKIDAVIEAYKKVTRSHRRVVECVLVSARELDESELEHLNNAIKTFLKEGESIKLKTKIDPTILGGISVSIGDKHFDLTLASRMEKFRKMLKAGIDPTFREEDMKAKDGSPMKC